LITRRVLLSLLSVIILGGIVFSLHTLSNARTYQMFGDLVARVDTEMPVVALTFDDGPTKGYTEEVLRILDELDVPATFFVTGREVTENKDETRAIIAAGHELGNHSYSHPRMVFKSYDTIRSEVEETDAAIRAAGYDGPLHFRPPYAKKLFGLPWYLSANDRTTVMWDVEPETYPDVAADLNAFVEHVIQRTSNGSIILMHVMYKSREVSRQALPGIVAGLRERGFEFVTVSQLLERRH
jgi:peptidoglycan/xylan/chitin deacetylase (PgdA/CDA1 family)